MTTVTMGITSQHLLTNQSPPVTRSNGRTTPVVRIWFNRAYSTTMHIIGLLRANPDGSPVHILGTHSDPDSPVLTACDVTEAEPDDEVVGDDYVEWALDVCRRHAVEVFVPRLHLDVVAAARARFTAAGVSLVAGPAGAARFLEDKAAAYADAVTAGLAVPPWHVVRSGSELVSAHEELSRFGVVCLKPVTGVGGAGFRVLTTEPLALEEVLTFPSDVARVDEVAASLDAWARSGQPVSPLLLMPFLTGPEVSVDCLGDEDGAMLAAVPRTKLSRRRLLVDDPGAVDVARTIVARHRLSSLSNTQVRYWCHPDLDAAPRPYLLETNARISGGLHQTALAGVNLPWAAVLLALGRPVVLPEPVLDVAFTTVSTPVRLAR